MSSFRSFKHGYRCPGCGKEFELTTLVDEQAIDRHRSPAPMIATEKMLTERKAANEHARVACRRPV